MLLPLAIVKRTTASKPRMKNLLDFLAIEKVLHAKIHTVRGAK
jgi:hypothetical protein